MKPIEVNEDRLTINARNMEMLKPYHFKFLDANLVAVRTPNGIELLQEVEYETIKNELE